MEFSDTTPWKCGLPSYSFGTEERFLADAKRSKVPIATMVTCWELGGTRNATLQEAWDKSIIIQNPIGLVPASDSRHIDTTLDSIRYALSYDSVKHLIVCGHLQCRTLDYLACEPEAEVSDRLGELPRNLRDRSDILAFTFPRRRRVANAVRQTVPQQLYNLASHDWILDAIQQRNLLLHAWVYDDATSEISIFDPSTSQFNPEQRSRLIE